MKIILNNNGVKKREIRQMVWWHDRAKYFMWMCIAEGLALIIIGLLMYFNK